MASNDGTGDVTDLRQLVVDSACTWNGKPLSAVQRATLEGFGGWVASHSREAELTTSLAAVTSGAAMDALLSGQVAARVVEGGRTAKGKPAPCPYRSHTWTRLVAWMARDGVTVLTQHTPGLPPGGRGQFNLTPDGTGLVAVCPDLSERAAVEMLLSWWAPRSWTGTMVALSYQMQADKRERRREEIRVAAGLD